MTLEDAFTVLGLDATATEDEVRRAYLKLVKKHRPERDPNGFQRVRQAYDLARERRAFYFDEADAPAPSAASTAVVVAPLPEGEVLDTASVQNDTGLEAFRKQAIDLADEDSAAAIKLWRAAVRAHPDSVEARWELIEAYFQAEKPERAGRALLRAYRRGLSDFAAALLARAPGHAPPELYEQAVHDPALTLAAAAGLVRSGDASAALPYLEALLTLEPSDRGGGFMLTQLVIEALSRLGEQGEVTHFERLAQVFSAYSKRDETALRGPHAAQWLVLRELGATAHLLPNFVFRALAESVVQQDATRLMQRLGSYTEDYPHGAADAQQVLKLHAPGLYNAYAPLLQPARAAPEWRRKGFGWPSIVPLLFLTFTLLRLCIPSGTREDRSAATPVVWTPSTAARPIFGPSHTAEPRYNQTFVDRAVSNLTWLAQDHDLPELGVGAATVGEAFPGECGPLAREMETLVGLTHHQDAGMITEVQTLYIEFEHACPVQAKTVPKP